MLVDAYNTCINQLPGTVDGCSVFEASRDEDKAWDCQSKGEVVAEVGCPELVYNEMIDADDHQAVGINAPLAQLPGNNPEFNSSRVSPDYPKRLFSDYSESAEIIAVDAQGGGSCSHLKCADYPAGP